MRITSCRHALGVAFLLAALVAGLATGARAAERPVVVSTFSVLDDMVRHVGGGLIETRVLTPIGNEVHEYELRPEDFVALEEADVIFFNGFMLEQWMDQVRATAREGTPLLAVAEESGWPTMPIRIGDFTGDPDPHLWMHPEAAVAYVGVIRDALIALLPDQATPLTEAAAAYGAAIEDAAATAGALLGAVPEVHRLLITSETAFLYFAAAFDWRHDGVWGSNAEDEGTPAQLRRVVDLVMAEQPPAIFYESTVPARHMRAIAEDTGVRVAGPLYVDSLGPEGSGAETYPGLLVANARIIREAMVED
jgi:manganese/iron transport system substrate-binding protein